MMLNSSVVVRGATVKLQSTIVLSSVWKGQVEGALKWLARFSSYSRFEGLLLLIINNIQY